MSGASEYRGITYAVPRTDDGAWRWVIYPKKDVKGLAQLNALPRQVYVSHDDAVKAANLAISSKLLRVAEIQH